jgi:hypothetical protein
MTAAIQDVTVTKKLGPDDVPAPSLLGLPMEANKIIFGGTFVANNAAGNAVDVGDAGALFAWGRCEKQVNNLSTNAPYGAAGAQQCLIKPGAYWINQDGSITAANVGQACFFLDNQTVGLQPVIASSTAFRPFAGIIQPPGFGEAGVVLPTNTFVPVFVGSPACVGQVLHANIDIPLATITAQTTAVAFNLGPVLPANCRLIDYNINVLTALSGGSATAVTMTLQGGSDAAGSLIASTSVFTGASSVIATVGSNPYPSRGGQQLKATLTNDGTHALSTLTAGHLSLDLFYTIVP